LQNKPKYHLFKNTQYALEGLICVIKTENSFRLELLASLFILPTIFLIHIELYLKLILLSTMFIVLIVELLNSAIENSVDLVTKQIHPLAKNAKDIGATAVMFSIILHISCWVLILVN
jgi:diacylglycerol kinase (ATP)